MNGLSSSELRDLILSIKGLTRNKRPLCPIEAAEYLERAMNGGATVRELKIALDLTTTTMIYRIRRLLSLSPSIRYHVGWKGSGKPIVYTVASELAKIPSYSAQEEASQLVIKNALSGFEVEQLVQRLLRARETVPKALDSILALRPTYIRRHVIVGAIQSRLLQEKLANLSQVERNKIGSLAIDDLLKDCGLTVHLGADRFTITGLEEDASAALSQIDSLEAEFEDAVNKVLS